MPSTEFLSDISEILATYSGRDKFIRTIGYATKFLSGISNNDNIAKKFQILSSQMSSARVVLRLFEDLPNLHELLSYNWGKNEPDMFMASLGNLMIISDQIYYIIEKIEFLSKHNIICVKNKEFWEKVSTYFWVLSIYLSVARSVHYLHLLQKEKFKRVGFKKDLSSTPLADLEDSQLSIERKLELISLIRSSLDGLYAVNSLPCGVLWAGRLQTWQVGVLGTISSLLGIYQIVYKRSLKKKVLS